MIIILTEIVIYGQDNNHNGDDGPPAGVPVITVVNSSIKLNNGQFNDR
jgi:hypothetical protein